MLFVSMENNISNLEYFFNKLSYILSQGNCFPKRANVFPCELVKSYFKFNTGPVSQA